MDFKKYDFKDLTFVSNIVKKIELLIEFLCNF